MSNANSQNKDCQDGVCEVTFRPMQAARRTFQNLKAMASDLIGKVKDTINGDSHNAAGEEVEEAAEDEQLDKMQASIFRQNYMEVGSGDCGQISSHSAAILDRLIQHSWQSMPDAGQMTSTTEHLKIVHVRPRPPAGQREAPRYSNPWRYDNHHKS